MASLYTPVNIESYKSILLNTYKYTPFKPKEKLNYFINNIINMGNGLYMIIVLEGIFIISTRCFCCTNLGYCVAEKTPDCDKKLNIAVGERALKVFYNIICENYPYLMREIVNKFNYPVFMPIIDSFIDITTCVCPCLLKIPLSGIIYFSSKPYSYKYIDINTSFFLQLMDYLLMTNFEKIIKLKYIKDDILISNEQWLICCLFAKYTVFDYSKTPGYVAQPPIIFDSIVSDKPYCSIVSFIEHNPIEKSSIECEE